MTHLTEEERQGAADGSLDVKRLGAVTAHIAECDACAADVAHLRALVSRARTTQPLGGVPDDPWSVIRARIEAGKLVSLPGRTLAARRTIWWGGVAAAALLIGTVLLLSPRGRQRSSDDAMGPAEGWGLTAVAESTSAYQQEIADRLSDLELRRALLRMETATSIDRDLKVIDGAIAELNDALAHDPNNPALRQLLATYYRHKLDLLKRVRNAS